MLRVRFRIGALALLALGTAGLVFDGTGMRAMDPSFLFALLSFVAGGFLMDYSRSQEARPRLVRGGPRLFVFLLLLSAVAGVVALVPFVHDAALATSPQTVWAIAFRDLYYLGAVYLVLMSFVVLWYVGLFCVHWGANRVGLTDERLEAIDRWPANDEGSALRRYWRYFRHRLDRGGRAG